MRIFTLDNNRSPRTKAVLKYRLTDSRNPVRTQVVEGPTDNVQFSLQLSLVLFNVGRTTKINFVLTPCFVLFFFLSNSIFRFSCCSLTFPPTTRTLRLTFMVTIRSAKKNNDCARVNISCVFLRLANYPDRPRVFRNAYISKSNSHQRLIRRFNICRNTTTMYSIFCRFRDN